MTDRSRSALDDAQQTLDGARRTFPGGTPAIHDAAENYGHALTAHIIQTVQADADNRREQWEQGGQLPWWMQLKNRFWLKVGRRA